MERSGISRRESQSGLDDTWIHWLHQTKLDGACDHRWFGEKVKRWLEILQHDAAEFNKQRQLISILTHDLIELFSLRKQYPRLFKSVLAFYKDPKGIAASRRKFLQRMQMKSVVSLLMTCWQNNVAALVPDPSTAHKSNYDDQAQWLLVVKERGCSRIPTAPERWRTMRRYRNTMLRCKVVR